MSKPVDETLTERRPLPRLYAHYHRLLIDLLEDLVEDARVVWLEGTFSGPTASPTPTARRSTSWKTSALIGSV